MKKGRWLGRGGHQAALLRRQLEAARHRRWSANNSRRLAGLEALMGLPGVQLGVNLQVPAKASPAPAPATPKRGSVLVDFVLPRGEVLTVGMEWPPPRTAALELLDTNGRREVHQFRLVTMKMNSNVGHITWVVYVRKLPGQDPISG